MVALALMPSRFERSRKWILRSLAAALAEGPRVLFSMHTRGARRSVNALCSRAVSAPVKGP